MTKQHTGYYIIDGVVDRAMHMTHGGTTNEFETYVKQAAATMAHSRSSLDKLV